MSLTRLGLVRPEAQCRSGWVADVLVPPNGLVGANGLRWGPDRRLYIAQAWGNQISAVDTELSISVISPASGPIVSPDDIAFDSRGRLFTTELMIGRVSMRSPDGTTKIVSDRVPGANGLTVVQDRVFVTEFREGGRLIELYTDGRETREIARGLMWPNALSLGHDGKLYFPLVPAGEIWRASPEDGTLEKFATGLSVATAVKFAPDGKLIALSAGDGTIHRYDIDTGAHDVVARMTPGMDNLEFGAGGEILVSSFVTGTVTAIGTDGSIRTMIEGGLLGPFGLAAGADGTLIVADGNSLSMVGSDGAVTTPLVTVTANDPIPWIRGIAVDTDGSLLFTSPGGDLTRYGSDGSVQTLAAGIDQAMGVATTDGGEIVVCAHGTGQLIGYRRGAVRVLASDLGRPTGVCVTSDGTILVADARKGRLLAVNGGTSNVLATGLGAPDGVAVSDDDVFVFDRAAGTLLSLNRHGGEPEPLLTGLAVDRGLPGNRTVPPGLSDVTTMHGPVGPFCGVAVTPDGSIHVACEADGSIWRVRRRAA